MPAIEEKWEEFNMSTTYSEQTVTRERGKAAIRQISAMNANTRYLAANGQVLARCPGGLSEEQKALLTSYRDSILLYLTVPPDRDHMWEITFYGVWLTKNAEQLRQEELL
jgi:hypothetical protein